MSNQTDEITDLSHLDPGPLYTHAMCVACWPDMPRQGEVTAWCGTKIDAATFPDDIPGEDIPAGACPECVEMRRCAVCGARGVR